MKRITYLWFVPVIMAGAMVTSSLGQQAGASPDPTSGSNQDKPLGDYARTLRGEKKPAAAKKFDNDNLPLEDKLSVVGNPQTAPPPDDAGAAAQTSATGSNADKLTKLPQVTPDQTPAQREQVYNQWQDKITTQKDKVDSLAKELDLLQREYRLRAAEVYNDAGSRLRNETTWDKEDTDYKKKLDDKQKELSEAKEGMDNLQDEARKAGVPNSVRESAAQGSSSQNQSDTSSQHN